MVEMEKDQVLRKTIGLIVSAGYNAELVGDDISITTKKNEPLKREEVIKLSLLMQKNDLAGYFPHPDPCYIVTDSRGIVLDYENDLFVFSGKEAYQRFVKNCCPNDILFFPHQLKWQTVLDKLSGHYEVAILDYNGEGVYKHIPLVKLSEIGGMA